MPSAAHILGASFLIDSLIGWNSGHQHKTIQDLKTSSKSNQPEETLEAPPHTPSDLRKAEKINSGGKLRLPEDNPLKGRIEGTTIIEQKLEILKSIKSDGTDWACGNVHSDKRELLKTSQLNASSTTFKTTNSDILCKVPEKPNQSYIALISRAILSSHEKRLQLSDIYQWIMENYPYYHNQEKSWRNSVRHNLSLNECFIKAGRSDNGKGHYWAVHPANLEAFSRGDYQRRRARRRVRRVSSVLEHQAHFPVCTFCCFHQRFCMCCPPLNSHSGLPQLCSLMEQPSQPAHWPFPLPLLWPWQQIPPYL